jgi:hypothetical protein
MGERPSVAHPSPAKVLERDGERHNITSDADQREAFRRVEKHLAELPKTANVTSIR